jgi:hypothetical protein
MLAFWLRAAGGVAECGRDGDIRSIARSTLDKSMASLSRPLVPQRVTGGTGGAHAWGVRTAPGTLRGVRACWPSLCKGCSTLSHTTTLRTFIQAPDLLVMPGIFDGFSARLVEQSGFAAGCISGGG